jgi:hypothetical protein
MKKKFIEGKYVFMSTDIKGNKQFLYQTGQGIQIKNNIHKGVLVIDPKNKALKRLSDNICFNKKYKDFKITSVESLIPKNVINEDGFIVKLFKRVIR